MIRCPLYVVAMSLLLHGCGDTGHAYCLCGEPYFKPGVLLTITDDCGTTITGATAVITGGLLPEFMDEISAGEYTGVYRGGGTFAVTIRADGYETVTVTDILVEDVICHDWPEPIEIVLSRL